MSDVWDRVLRRLENTVSRHDFHTWLKPTALASDDGRVLEIRVPNAEVTYWLKKHYPDAIKEALEALGRKGTKVTYVAGPPIEKPTAKRGRGKTLQGHAVEFEDVEPWPDVVDGPVLLDALARAFERFAALPDHGSTALALWTMHTYTHDAAFISPILAVTSPMKGCGKSSVLMVLGGLVARRLIAAHMTPSVLFRTIEKYAPTLLMDEGDTFVRDNDALRGLLNAGHTRTTARIIRTVGDDYEPRLFSTWGPKAIASIGRLPDTLEDRAIQIAMRRRPHTDRARARADRLRGDRIDSLCLELRRQARRWADDHLDALRDADPDVPEILTDRAADNWRPLFAIADLAGGAWPARARTAAEALSARDDDQDVHVELLRDLADILYPPDAAESIAAGAELISSSQLVDALVSMVDRPWGTWGSWRGDQALTARGLAVLLKPLGIYPAGRQRIGDLIVRGYRRDAFDDAFTRYLPPHVAKWIKPNIDGLKASIPSGSEAPADPHAQVDHSPVFIESDPLDHLVREKTGELPQALQKRRSPLPAHTTTVARATLSTPRPRDRRRQKGTGR